MNYIKTGGSICINTNTQSTIVDRLDPVYHIIIDCHKKGIEITDLVMNKYLFANSYLSRTYSKVEASKLIQCINNVHIDYGLVTYVPMKSSTLIKGVRGLSIKEYKIDPFALRYLDLPMITINEAFAESNKVYLGKFLLGSTGSIDLKEVTDTYRYTGSCILREMLIKQKDGEIKRMKTYDSTDKE